MRRRSLTCRTLALAGLLVWPSTAWPVVNVETGAYQNWWIDLSDSALDIRRDYASQADGFDGLFGRNWSSQFDTRLFRRGQAYVIVALGDRGETVFRPDPARPGLLVSEEGSLTPDLDGYLFEPALANADSVGHLEPAAFDRSGRLLRKGPVGLPDFELTWREAELRRITSHGRAYEVGSTLFGKVEEIKTPEGRSIAYRYDAAGNLVEVRNVWQNVYRFAYGASFLLDRVGYPDKTELRMSYDSAGRIIAFKDRKTPQASCDVRYNYGGTNFDHTWTRETHTCTSPSGGVTEDRKLTEWFRQKRNGRFEVSRKRIWSLGTGLVDTRFDIVTGRIIEQVTTRPVQPPDVAEP